MKSRPTPRAAAAIAIALAGAAAAGCGSGGAGSTAAAAGGQRAGGGAPAGWRTATTAAGLALSYPATWTPLPGDPGSLSAALRVPDGTIAGYLNLTPRSGDERISNWATFRPRHERGEGDREVRVIAASRRRLRGAPAACVKDSYRTRTGARYVELACLVEGTRPAVVLGAAPPSRWAAEATVLERAIAAAGA